MSGISLPTDTINLGLCSFSYIPFPRSFLLNVLDPCFSFPFHPRRGAQLPKNQGKRMAQINRLHQYLFTWRQKKSILPVYETRAQKLLYPVIEYWIDIK